MVLWRRLGCAGLLLLVGLVVVVPDGSGDARGVATSTGSDYQALTPARIVDTRLSLGAAGPMGQDHSIDVKVTGVGGVPASGVAAVVVNVTATNPTESTYVTVWPTGATRPTASNLNVEAGQS